MGTPRKRPKTFTSYHESMYGYVSLVVLDIHFIILMVEGDKVLPSDHLYWGIKKSINIRIIEDYYIIYYGNGNGKC